jgi:hypothetical protein
MQLIDYWKAIWWRRWSTWAAAAYAAATAAITLYPSLLIELLSNFPGASRAFLSGIIFVILFVVPILVAITKQPKLEAKVEQLKAVDAIVAAAQTSSPPPPEAVAVLNMAPAPAVVVPEPAPAPIPPENPDALNSGPAIPPVS